MGMALVTAITDAGSPGKTGALLLNKIGAVLVTGGTGRTFAADIRLSAVETVNANDPGIQFPFDIEAVRGSKVFMVPRNIFTHNRSFPCCRKQRIGYTICRSKCCLCRDNFYPAKNQ